MVVNDHLLREELVAVRYTANNKSIASCGMWQCCIVYNVLQP